MATARHIQLGKEGEEKAAKFLQSKGYKIIERNFKKRYGDIDIVAKDRDTLVFIEVKTRTSNLFGSGLEAITPWKIRALIRSAQFYKLKHPELPDRLRIDVVAVKLFPAGGVETIELVKNVTG